MLFQTPLKSLKICNVQWNAIKNAVYVVYKRYKLRFTVVVLTKTMMCFPEEAV